MDLYLPHIWLIHWFGYTVYNASSHFTSRTAPVPLHVRQPPAPAPYESCIWRRDSLDLNLSYLPVFFYP
jgi:hypothetical protein